MTASSDIPPGRSGPTIEAPAKILVIVGSTRARRICPRIAEWVAEIGRSTVPHRFEVVDLKDWPLPWDDEPGIPAAGIYACEHTRAWSGKVSEGQAFVFVSPQYNWGYPAPLKNALDHLYREWSGKPAMVVTYGGHGGGKCAAQLRQVLEGLHMEPCSIEPGFRLARDRIEANTGTVEPATEFADHLDMLKDAFGELDAMLRKRRNG
jgi:NAD(P)H-dependent FMN reductase